MVSNYILVDQVQLPHFIYFIISIAFEREREREMEKGMRVGGEQRKERLERKKGKKGLERRERKKMKKEFNFYWELYLSQA